MYEALDKKTVKSLIIGIIEQACLDYKLLCKYRRKGKEVDIYRFLELARFFLLDNQGYFDETTLNGQQLLKKLTTIEGSPSYNELMEVVNL